MKTFSIYKSSAGSGKTYTLVKEYLKIVLRQPHTMRHILAITFTNAAAAEMKHRILSELARISKPEQQPGVRRFIEELHGELLIEHGPDNTPSQQELTENARTVLKLILHNYSDFSVSTIDSFAHRIIRSFAFDLQLPLNFDVELDSAALLEQAVDLLVSRAGHDKQLTRVLVAFIERQTDDGRDLRIESLIGKLAMTLLEEDGALSTEKMKHLSLDDFFGIIELLQKEISSFEKEVTGIAQQACATIDSSGVPAKAFFQGSKGICGYFTNLAKGMIQEKLEPNSLVKKTIEEDKWYAGKATAAEKSDIDAIKNELIRLYRSVEELRERQQQQYFLCMAVNRNIFPLAVLNETAKVLQEVKDENILLHISDFNKKIADIVAQQPVPFIYERIGERYRHYMIDEFQDTSSLQWQNLLPLVENSLAGGHSSLVVGDGKQAIYRWRSGDVAQFASLPKIPPTITAGFRQQWEDSLVRHHQVMNLETNWRSRQQIVEFNNSFFEMASGLLSEELKGIYNEIRQKSLESKPGGYVEISFTGGKDEDGEDLQQQQTLDKITETIERLTESGHQLSDITILCRANKEGSLVARHLLENGISVISSESLLLNQSEAVIFMCSLIKLAVNPEDKTAALEVLGYLYKSGMLSGDKGLHHYLELAGLFSPSGSYSPGPLTAPLEQLMKQYGISWSFAAIINRNIYDVCEKIVQVFFAGDKKPDPFVAFFMDVVFDYSEKYNLALTDFLEWWEKEGRKFSLELPQGLNAVQVMTIHRSKGLQFPVVIYPFAQPGKVMQTKDAQWAGLKLDNIPQLTTTWVTLTKPGTCNTPFAELLEKEKQSTFLDILNLLYVAFTRPEEKLIIISGPVKKNSKTGLPDPLSVNGMLHSYLSQKGMWREGQDLYSIGSFDPCSQKREEPAEPSAAFSSYISSPWHRAIRLKSNQAERSITRGRREHLEKGNLLHRAMENINTTHDILPVLNRMFTNGELDEATRDEWSQSLMELLNHEELRGCFQKDSITRKEAGIFDADGQFYRPDRVVFTKENTIIIDYKTGEEYPSHKTQMDNYARLLSSMGYKNIKKVLVYLDKGKVESEK